MLLKVICQICGRTKVLDTERPCLWEIYKLKELGITDEPFSDYEIWICPKCLEKAVVRWEVECYGDDPENLMKGELKVYLRNIFRKRWPRLRIS